MAKQETQSPASALAILRRREVEARTGLGCSTIYDGIKAGTFPAPVALSSRCVRFRSDLVAAWMEAQATAVDMTRSARTAKASKAMARRRGLAAV